MSPSSAPFDLPSSSFFCLLQVDEALHLPGTPGHLGHVIMILQVAMLSSYFTLPSACDSFYRFIGRCRTAVILRGMRGKDGLRGINYPEHVVMYYGSQAGDAPPTPHLTRIK